MIRSDVGQNLEINLCNLLYLIFLCNFRYFRIMVFISLFEGAFNAFQVKVGSYYGQTLIRSYFRIYFHVCKHFFFLATIQSIKFRLFVSYFLMDSRPFILVDLRTLMDSRFFLEANVFCFLFSRNRRVLLLDISASRITQLAQKKWD